ncbi:hypothetical protein TNCV_2317131 [Trichonephila clavipes]|nr:hypothetical protein TNCV_2317131 [Trichonephila clavipes]
MQHDCALRIAARRFLTSFSVEYKNYCLSVLPWPARSPDLSPIKPIWDHLGWRVGHPNEFEGTRGKVTANMERNVSRRHTEL